jgi:hypothetical protein
MTVLLNTAPARDTYVSTIPATAGAYYPTTDRLAKSIVSLVANGYLSISAPKRSIFIGTLSGANPAAGDNLTWGGTGTGEVVSYDATRGKLVYMPSFVASAPGAHPIRYQEIAAGDTVTYPGPETFVAKDSPLILPRPFIVVHEVSGLLGQVSRTTDTLELEDHEGNNYQKYTGQLVGTALVTGDSVFTKNFPLGIELQEGLRFAVGGAVGAWDVVWSISRWTQGQLARPS